MRRKHRTLMNDIAPCKRERAGHVFLSALVRPATDLSW
jgi:hypothetical protein